MSLKKKAKTKKKVSKKKTSKKTTSKKRIPKPEIGWREWVGLPDLCIPKIKVKVDTGARTSSLHAYDIEIYERAGHRWAKFKVHPDQRNTKKVITMRAKILEKRHVKSSTGHVEKRVVIQTKVKMAKELYLIELTLTNRDMMGFRMLLGREAIRSRFLVDPGKSFLIDKKTKKKVKK